MGESGVEKSEEREKKLVGVRAFSKMCHNLGQGEAPEGLSIGTNLAETPSSEGCVCVCVLG